MIVEDSDDARVSLQMILEGAGHRVQTAAGGPSGVDAIPRWKPDVALVDIGLPGLDGYGVARRALESGFDAHLTKPAPVDRLLEMVAAAS